MTILDSNIWRNVTFNDIKHDAEKALDILIEQPEVDANRITVLGHSEGTIITPWVAIDNPSKIKNIILIGAIAQNFKKIAEFQVTVPILYAKEVLDHNHKGLLSLQEANENPIFSTVIGKFTLILTQNITNTSNVTSTTNTSFILIQQQLNPEYNTNKDVYISIDNELKPKLFELFESKLVITPGKKCTLTDWPCPIWVKSHYDVSQSTVNIIGNVSSSILILQGENDIQTPIQQAFLLQQKLTDVRHHDHILITYPNLGHSFYPLSKWQTGVGPIEQYVLKDLYAWLESHNGFTPMPTFSSSSSTSNTTKINN
jgi:esterase/lipase